MANAVEKLFKEVAKVAKPSPEIDWPEGPAREDRFAEAAEMNSFADDLILGLKEYESPRNLEERNQSRRRLRSLDDEGRAIIAGGLRHKGLDVLAFYKSRRWIDDHPAKGYWGIFYLAPGIAYLAEIIARYYPGFSDPHELALKFLRCHEFFHYRADVQTLLLEATLKKQLYGPVKNLFAGRPEYFVEEALANRQCWDWAKQSRVGLSEFASDLMSLQPREYARFDDNRLELASEWAGIVVDQQPPGNGVRNDLQHWVEAAPESLLRSSLCPEWVIQPVELSIWISPYRKLPPVDSIDESKKVKNLCSGPYSDKKAKWDSTKDKLLTEPNLPGLQLKPWPNDGDNCYSVKIDRNFRAHLRYKGNGRWLAYKLGTHKAMGHG